MSAEQLSRIESGRERAVRALAQLGISEVAARDAHAKQFEALIRGWQAFLGRPVPIVATVLEVHDTHTHDIHPYERLLAGGESTDRLPAEWYVVEEVTIDPTNQKVAVYIRSQTDIDGRFLYNIKLDEVEVAPEADRAVLSARVADGGIDLSGAT